MQFLSGGERIQNKFISPWLESPGVGNATRCCRVVVFMNEQRSKSRSQWELLGPHQNFHLKNGRNIQSSAEWLPNSLMLCMSCFQWSLKEWEHSRTTPSSHPVARLSLSHTETYRNPAVPEQWHTHTQTLGRKHVGVDELTSRAACWCSSINSSEFIIKMKNLATSLGASQWCPDLCRQTSRSPPLLSSKGLSKASRTLACVY